MLIQFNLNLIDLGLLVLAAWRLTHFIVYERGPFTSMLWIRENVFRHTYDSELAEYSIPPWSEVFSCMWCLSIYIFALLLGMHVYILYLADFLILLLAGSALIVLIQKQTTTWIDG